MSTAAPKRKRPSFAEVVSQGWKPPARRVRGPGARPTATGKGGPKGKRRKGSRDGKSPAGAGVGESQLVKQQEELARKFAELQWDLGGIAYEMASRDHYRLDVLAKRAAKLREVDSQLGQIERVMRLEEAGAAGTCPSCNALQARGAVFCWQCGFELRKRTKPSDKPKSANSPRPSKPPASAKSK